MAHSTWLAVDDVISIHVSAALCQNTSTVLLQLVHRAGNDKVSDGALLVG